MELGLYTDSVGRLGFEEALDFAIENEDVAQDPIAGCTEAAEFIHQFLAAFRTDPGLQ